MSNVGKYPILGESELWQQAISRPNNVATTAESAGVLLSLLYPTKYTTLLVLQVRVLYLVWIMNIPNNLRL